MTAINCLTEASAVSSSMQIPVYDATNGQPRKISVNQLLEFFEDNFDPSGAPLTILSATVAQLTDDYPAASYPNAVVYCSNGDAGSPCLAVSNGTAWKRIALGATVAAS